MSRAAANRLHKSVRHQDREAPLHRQRMLLRGKNGQKVIHMLESNVWISIEDCG